MAKVNISSLSILLSANNRGLVSALADSRNRMQKFGNDVDDIGDGFKRLRGAVAAVATTVAALKLGQVAKSFIDDSIRLAADAETAQTQLKVMLGSAQEAKKLLSELEDFALATPFRLDGLRDATKQLLAYGIAQTDILPTLKSLGDIAAGSGSQLSDLAEIYGRVAVSNRLAGEEINRLQDRAIPILTLLADQLRISEAEVRKLASEGKVGFAELQRAFADLTTTGGKFNNQMRELSQTTAGLYSSFQDQIDAIKRDVGTGLLPAMKEWLDITSALVANGQQIDLARDVREITALITAAVKGIAGLFEFSRSGITAIAREFVRDLNSLPEQLDRLFGTSIADPGRVLVEELDNMSRRLGESGAKFVGLLKEDRFGRQISKQFDGLETVIKDTDKATKGLASTVTEVSDAYKRMVDAATQSADSIKSRYAEPIDEFKIRIAELNQALVSGLIDQRLAAKGFSKEIKTLLDSVRTQRVAVPNVGALRKGSQEEIAARNQRFVGGLSNEREAQIIDLANELIKLSRDSAEKLRAAGKFRLPDSNRNEASDLRFRSDEKVPIGTSVDAERLRTSQLRDPNGSNAAERKELITIARGIGIDVKSIAAHAATLATRPEPRPVVINEVSV